jgi:hypothetical protein
LKLARSMPGFDYSSVEWRRLDTIARDVTPGVFAVWLITVVVIFVFLVLPLICLILFGPILYWYPGKTTVPVPLVVGALAFMIVFAAVGFPVAMAVAGLTVDRLCKLQPLSEVEGDAALFRKIRSQIVRVVAVGIAGVGLLELIEWLFGR